MHAFCRYDLRMSEDEYRTAPLQLVLAMFKRWTAEQRKYRTLLYAITGDKSLIEEEAKPKDFGSFVNQQLIAAGKQPVPFKPR